MTLLSAVGLALAGRLQKTSLTLEEGTLTCLVGPNGSGKTSLLHALVGIRVPSGRVTIDGADPRTLGPGARQRLLAYMPASRDVHWPVSAADLVALGSPNAPSRVRAILGDLGLAEMAERRIDRMSTGERSRVLLARALVADPKVLLLDEPVANLDPLWQLRLLEYLRRLTHGSGRAVLAAVHDLELARRFADRLLIMDGGRIVADGEAGPLLAGPQMPAVFGIRWAEGGWEPVA